MYWHTLSVDTVLREMESALTGITSGEALLRLAKQGPNELEEKKKKPSWYLFLHQFKDFMILVLIMAAIVSGVVGDITDTIIILVIVIINAVVGYIQEFRAEKALDALKKNGKSSGTRNP